MLWCRYLKQWVLGSFPAFSVELKVLVKFSLKAEHCGRFREAPCNSHRVSGSLPAALRPDPSSLQALVPVTIEVEVPFDLHRYIIGQKGSGIRKMMDEFEVPGFAVFPWEPVLGPSPPSGPRRLSPLGDAPLPARARQPRSRCGAPAHIGSVRISAQVNIHVPAPELQSDIIAITGLAANLGRAKAGLLERVRELQAEQEDRVGGPQSRGPAAQEASPGVALWAVTQWRQS